MAYRAKTKSQADTYFAGFKFAEIDHMGREPWDGYPEIPRDAGEYEAFKAGISEYWRIALDHKVCKPAY